MPGDRGQIPRHGGPVSATRKELVAPPALHHLGVAGVVSGAEREVLDAIGTCLDRPHRVLVESDRGETSLELCRHPEVRCLVHLSDASPASAAPPITRIGAVPLTGWSPPKSDSSTPSPRV